MNFPRPNLTIEYKYFHISYNMVDTSIYGCDTTAIVGKGLSVFYILNGDHRKVCKDIADKDGWNGLLDYFMSNIDKMNHRSETVCSRLSTREIQGSFAHYMQTRNKNK